MDQPQPPSFPVPPIPANPGIPPASGSNSSSKKVLFGCGGCAVLAVVAIVIFAVGIFVFVTKVIKSTDVYRESVQLAVNSAEVQDLLGTPIEEGWMPMGSIQTSNGHGSASFYIALTGPKGKGVLNVDASKTPGGEWGYKVLEFSVDQTGQIINLKPAVLRN